MEKSDTIIANHLELIQEIEKLIQDPIPEASEFYYPENGYYSEHTAFYEGRNSAFKEIISLLAK